MEVKQGEKDWVVTFWGCSYPHHPPFGASVQEMQLLKDKDCTIVDTTCPWVSKVWNTVEKHKKAITPRLFTTI